MSPAVKIGPLGINQLLHDQALSLMRTQTHSSRNLCALVPYSCEGESHWWIPYFVSAMGTLPSVLLLANLPSRAEPSSALAPSFPQESGRGLSSLIYCPSTALLGEGGPATARDAGNTWQQYGKKAQGRSKGGGRGRRGGVRLRTDPLRASLPPPPSTPTHP